MGACVACGDEAGRGSSARVSLSFVSASPDAALSPADVGAASVDEGTYATLKLETKDLVSSAGDDESEMEDLGETVRAAYPEWPDDASLRVAGSFDADEVGVAVEIDPLAWFALSDGTVQDLSVYDYGTTGEVVELEAKMADGFTKIEVGG